MQPKIATFLLFFVLFQIFSFSIRAQVPVANNGIIDLRHINFKTQKYVELRGEWLLVPHNFVSYKTIETLKSDSVAVFNQPGNWNGFNFNGQRLSGQGIATLYLKILLPENFRRVGLKVGTPNTAFQVYFNDSLAYTVGKVSKTKEGFYPGKNPGIVADWISSDTLHLVMHVANFIDYHGGNWAPVYLGAPETVSAYRYRLFFMDLFLMGAILIIALYHLGLYVNRVSEKSNLYFALFSFLVFIRIFVTGESFIFYLFPNTGWYASVFLEYFGLSFMPWIFMAFIRSVIPTYFSKKILKLITAVCLSYAAVVLFSPAFVYTAFLFPFQLFIIITAAYGIYVMLRSVVNGNRNARIMVTGFFLLFLAIVNDVLYAQYIISTIFLVPFGMFLFIFSQAYLLSTKFSKAYTETEQLSFRLSNLNKNLEWIIEERTSEIQQNKEEIEAQAQNLLEANHRIFEKNTELNKFNQQMQDSIRYAGRIQTSVFPTNSWLHQNFSEHFILFKPRDIVSGDFYWFQKIHTKIFIAAADCTGHGVPGAFLSLLGVTLLNELVLNNSDCNPSEILEKMRSRFITALHQNEVQTISRDGIDIALISIDTERLMLNFSGANNGVLWIRNAVLNQLDGVRNPIGPYPVIRQFETQTLQLLKGDNIYLFSDGFYDQINPDREKLKKAVFKRFILEKSGLPMAEQKNALLQYLSLWQGNALQVDDIMIIGIKI